MAFVLALSTRAGVAVAQGTPPTRAAEDAIVGDIGTVLGASRFEQGVSEAPASVTIVTRNEIERFGWRTLGALINSVRGFNTTNDRNYTYLAVRGFGPSGDYNARVLVLLDGVRVNENIFDAAYLGLESVVDLDQIERVEVIRGPSSSIYGAGAVFGVVNIITRHGRDVQRTTLNLEAGSYGTRAMRLSTGQRRAAGLEYFASAGAYDSRGQDLYFPEFDAAATNRGIAAGLDGERRESAFASMAIGEFSSHIAFAERQKDIPTASFGTLFNVLGSRTMDRTLQVKTAYDHTFENNAVLSASVAYLRSDYDGKYVYSDGQHREDANGRVLIGESRYVRTLGSRQRLIVGGEFRDNLRQSQSVTAPGAVPFADNTRSDVWALFAQDEVRIGRFIVNGGVRHDHYGSFGGTTNPRLALILGNGQESSLKLLLGRSFRPPNNYELYYQDGVSAKRPLHIGPEQIQTRELVAQHRAAPWLLLSGSLYRTKMKDLISLEVDSADSKLVYENDGRVAANGAEGEVEVNVGSATARLSYTLQRTEYTKSGQEEENSPRHVGKLHLAAPLYHERLSAAVEAVAMSARLNARRESVPGFVVANLTLLTLKSWHGARASASVYNVLDRRYGFPSPADIRQRAIPQDRRSVRLSVQLSR